MVDEIFDALTNLWHICEVNTSTERLFCGATVTNKHDPHLILFGGKSRKGENLRSTDSVSFYRLQPDLLPSWRPDLHQYYSDQSKITVMIMLQVTQRGHLPIPNEILIDHIFPYVCSPRYYRWVICVKRLTKSKLKKKEVILWLPIFKA